MEPTDTVKATNGMVAKLYHGNGEDVVPTLSGIHTLITDPPYLHTHMGGGGCFQDSNQKVFSKESRLKEIIGSYDIETMFDLWLGCGVQNMVIFCSNEQIEDTIRAMRSNDLFYTVGAWWKYDSCPMVNNTWRPDAEYWIAARKKGSYFNNDVPVEWKGRIRRRPMERERRWHPTAKPVGLLNEFATVLCPPGETILDSFMGSGSTALAALRGGWNFVGVEKDDEYYPRTVREIRKEAEQERMF